MTTTARTEAWYRRETAIHEAGHFVIAKHLGIRSRARIYRHETYGWTGEVVPETSTKRLSKHEKLMIAVAGFVATAMWVKDDPTAVLRRTRL